MSGKYSGIYIHRPSSGGSAGPNISARSSVSIDVCCVCNPVVTWLQEFPTSGFYGEFGHAVIDAMSTASGLCLKPKTSPTVARIASRICAESSLRAARLSSDDTAQIAKSFSSQSPWLAPCNRAPFFRGDA
jgi:hypothetical protein